jgi:hypothetical protein
VSKKAKGDRQDAKDRTREPEGPRRTRSSSASAGERSSGADASAAGSLRTAQKRAQERARDRDILAAVEARLGHEHERVRALVEAELRRWDQDFGPHMQRAVAERVLEALDGHLEGTNRRWVPTKCRSNGRCAVCLLGS